MFCVGSIEFASTYTCMMSILVFDDSLIIIFSYFILNIISTVLYSEYVRETRDCIFDDAAIPIGRPIIVTVPTRERRECFRIFCGNQSLNDNANKPILVTRMRRGNK